MKQTKILQYSDRFSSFETWKEALEKEWAEESAAFKLEEKNHQDAKSSYRTQLNKHRHHKLKAYKQFRSFTSAAKELESLFTKHGATQEFRQEEQKLDERFRAFAMIASEIIKPNPKQIMEWIQNEEEILRKKWVQINKEAQYLRPRNGCISRQGYINSQRTATLPYIEALEKNAANPAHTVRNCSNSPFIHPDIKSGLYAYYLEEMRSAANDYNLQDKLSELETRLYTMVDSPIPARFTSFESWRKALEEEWKTAPRIVRAKIQEIADAKKAYRNEYNQHLGKKLAAYNHYPAFRPAIEVLNTLRKQSHALEKNKLKKDLITKILDKERYLDDLFDRLSQSKSELNNQNAEFKAKNQALEGQCQQIWKLKEELKILSKPESQKRITLECIDTLEKNDAQTERVLNYNSTHPYLHPDIKERRYEPYLQQMLNPGPKHELAPKQAYFPLVQHYKQKSPETNIWSKDFKSANTSWAERSQSPAPNSPNSYSK